MPANKESPNGTRREEVPFVLPDHGFALFRTEPHPQNDACPAWQYMAYRNPDGTLNALKIIDLITILNRIPFVSSDLRKQYWDLIDVVIDEGGPTANVNNVTNALFAMGNVDATTRVLLCEYARAIKNWFAMVAKSKLLKHCLEGLMDTAPMPRYQDMRYVLPISRSAPAAQRANPRILTEYQEIVASCRLYKQQSRKGDGMDVPTFNFQQRLSYAHRLGTAMLDQSDMKEDHPEKALANLQGLEPIEVDVVTLRQVDRIHKMQAGNPEVPRWQTGLKIENYRGIQEQPYSNFGARFDPFHKLMTESKWAASNLLQSDFYSAKFAEDPRGALLAKLQNQKINRNRKTLIDEAVDARQAKSEEAEAKGSKTTASETLGSKGKDTNVASGPKTVTPSPLATAPTAVSSTIAVGGSSSVGQGQAPRFAQQSPGLMPPAYPMSQHSVATASPLDLQAATTSFTYQEQSGFTSSIPAVSGIQHTQPGDTSHSSTQYRSLHNSGSHDQGNRHFMTSPGENQSQSPGSSGSSSNSLGRLLVPRTDNEQEPTSRENISQEHQEYITPAGRTLLPSRRSLGSGSSTSLSTGPNSETLPSASDAVTNNVTEMRTGDGASQQQVTGHPHHSNIEQAGVDVCPDDNDSFVALLNAEYQYRESDFDNSFLDPGIYEISNALLKRSADGDDGGEEATSDRPAKRQRS